MAVDFKPNQNDYKNLTPFKSWLLLQINTWGQNNFPFVESDFDELTNFGMMQKLMKAVNDVISNENLVEDDMTNLFDAYTELQNYVNNYFDNLDVQDEINNKLDSMAEDGSLTNLIKNYVDPIQDAFESDVNSQLNQMNTKIDNATSGSPLVASSISGMTDTSRVYVNTTDGKWYYYDGDSWEIGGVYQSTSDSDTIKFLQDNMNYYGTTLNLALEGSSITTNLWLEAGKTYLITKLAPATSIEGKLFIEGYGSNNISIPNVGVMRFFTPAYSGYLRFYNTNSVTGEVLSIRVYGLVDKIEDYIYGYDVTNTDITGVYVKQNDTIKVDVTSNTEQTLMYIDPYGAGSTYLTIPTGAGKYTYKADKNGYVRFQNSGTSINAKIYVMNGIINQLDDNKVYIVDKNGNGDYTSFTEMLIDLQNDTNEKIVYVNNGTYDIYEELGGDAFIATITAPANTNWRDVNYCVPKNTHIIGLGNVLLKFAPTAEQIGSNEMAFLFSPLNISDTCIIENISVFGTNCRYAIHDESSGFSAYDNTIHKYINVTAEKQRGTYGNAQVFGSGLARNCYWQFDNCIFNSDYQGIWTCHTTTSSPNDTSKVTFNNCIFNNTAETGSTSDTIQFISGSVSSHQGLKNIIKFNNCYVTGKIGLTGDSGATQRYDLTLLKTTSQGIRIQSDLVNEYTPKIYN